MNVELRKEKCRIPVKTGFATGKTNVTINEKLRQIYQWSSHQLLSLTVYYMKIMQMAL